MKKIPPKTQGWLLIVLAILLMLLAAALNAPMEAHHKLLVSAEGVADGPFKKSVILVLRHDLSGAFGVAINKGSEGGPIETNRTFVLHTSDVILPQSTMIAGKDIGYAEGHEAVEALKSLPEKPRWSLVVNGYAGWESRQLDKEIKAGKWKVIPYDATIVTKTLRPAIWGKAIRQASGKKEP